MNHEELDGVLVLPRMRVQNANAISSPMTWGFPAMTHFLGLIQALERQLPEHIEVAMHSVGVVCHNAEPQISEGGYTRAFRLTRNPVDKDGSTAAIVEEGRIHLEISLVIGISNSPEEEAQQQSVAKEIADQVATMRIAGGSVLPAGNYPNGCQKKPWITPLDEDDSKRDKQMRRLCRRLLPGFALVCRDDLLQERLAQLRQEKPEATSLDAWLDLCRLHHYPDLPDSDSSSEQVAWKVSRRPGWIVPIPVGYSALSKLYDPGAIQRARDSTTPFRFVESLYSIGQWISPHRVNAITDLLWYTETDTEKGLYRCNNNFHQTTAVL